jgi:nucleoside-diphosphate-sugar epimerase
MFADCSKAQRELGFDPAPIQPALARAVKWFQRSGP